MDKLISGRVLRYLIGGSLALSWSLSAMAGAHESESPAAATDAGMDHSMHNMAGHSAERDEMGRRLYGMKHEMTPEIMAELREKIPLYESYSDAEINMSMMMMGSNYEWYLSDADVQGSQAVLLLLHGFREGDPIFKEQVQGYATIFPTAMAPGMSMMMSDHIQLAIDDLEAAGAQTIVVVPVVSTEYNTMMRQWEYIFGLQDEAPYASVARVSSDAEILFAKPPGDDPVIAEILIDHAMELSEDPKREAVVIAAHGPSFEDDNKKVLAELASLAGIIKEDSDFAEVDAITLQDDAPAAIRDANVAKLRAMVKAANDRGLQVIVVTNLIGTRTIQAKLRKDLKGLDYRFNNKGISEHPSFVNEWLGDTIRAQLENN